MSDHTEALGIRARWGRVGYAGEAHVAVEGTYGAVDHVRARYTSAADSGWETAPPAGVANLILLLMAALAEVGFALEAGPLSTWSN